jgi:hypothetical protein
LAAGRVATLAIDPWHEYCATRLGPAAVEALRMAEDDMVAECAVELAVTRGARIAAVAIADAPALGDVDGMAALLRY